MITGFAADGVVDLTWQACHIYNIEVIRVDGYTQNVFNMPTLHLESDYAEKDTEQQRVRIETYIEML
jgi:benzoyl-CoA reductase/2-hydroxyglutaryl-CoA dehydratase subunit BcrC/BadD/HgdB